MRGWRGGQWSISIHAPREGCDLFLFLFVFVILNFNPRTPRGVRLLYLRPVSNHFVFQSTHPARGATFTNAANRGERFNFNPRTPRGVRRFTTSSNKSNNNFNPRTPRGVRQGGETDPVPASDYFNPRTPRGVRQQTLPKSREFAWLNLLICTRGRRLSIQKQTRLCSIKLSFMLFGCEPAGEGVSSWTSHATKSKVRLEGRSAYSQSARSSAHSDFPGNKSGDCPVRGP